MASRKSSHKRSVAKRASRKVSHKRSVSRKASRKVSKRSHKRSVSRKVSRKSMKRSHSRKVSRKVSRKSLRRSRKVSRKVSKKSQRRSRSRKASRKGSKRKSADLASLYEKFQGKEKMVMDKILSFVPGKYYEQVSDLLTVNKAATRTVATALVAIGGVLGYKVVKAILAKMSRSRQDITIGK